MNTNIIPHAKIGDIEHIIASKMEYKQIDDKLHNGLDMSGCLFIIVLTHEPIQHTIIAIITYIVTGVQFII